MKITSKIISFWESYIRTESFKKNVLLIRKAIGIPEEGLPLEDDYHKNSTLYAELLFSPVNLNKKPEVGDLYREIFNKVPVPYQNSDTILFVNGYIRYNETMFWIFEEDAQHNPIVLVDILSEVMDLPHCDNNCHTQQYFDSLSQRYPVAIALSPYQGIGELVDFVRNKYEDASKLLNDHISSGNIEYDEESFVKTRGLRKRSQKSFLLEDIVYDNRDKSLAEIAEIVLKNTGLHKDQGEIGKIKSLAIQRRNNENN